MLFAALAGADHAEISVSLAKIGEVPAALERAISEELAASLRELAGKRASFVAPGREVLAIKLVAGPTRIRLLAERAETAARAEANLSRGATTFRTELDEVVRRLFPEAIPKLSLDLPAPVAPKIREEETSGVRWAAWVTSGASVGLVIAGAVLGVSSRAALGDLEERALPAEEFRAASDRARGHGTAANILFAGAATCAVTGALLFVLE